MKLIDYLPDGLCMLLGNIWWRIHPYSCRICDKCGKEWGESGLLWRWIKRPCPHCGGKARNMTVTELIGLFDD